MATKTKKKKIEIQSPWGLDAEARKPLPRGRHALSRETVLASQRGRLLHAVLIAVAQKGFGSVVVGDVIAEAGVSRKAFYEHFDGFDECWSEAWEIAIDVLFVEIGKAVAERGDLTDREALIGLGAEVSLTLSAAEPLVAHATLLDVLGAGPAGVKASQEVVERHANLILMTWDGKSFADSTEERRLAAMAAVSIYSGTVRAYLGADRADEMPALADQLTKLIIATLKA